MFVVGFTVLAVRSTLPRSSLTVFVWRWAVCWCSLFALRRDTDTCLAACLRFDIGSGGLRLLSKWTVIKSWSFLRDSSSSEVEWCKLGTFASAGASFKLLRELIPENLQDAD